MIIFAFASMLIALVAVIFALSNTAPASVNFVVWSFQGSLALILLAALFSGILLTFLAAMPSVIRNRWTIRQLRKKLQAAEDILTEHNLAPAQTAARAADAKQKKDELKRKPVTPVAALPELKPLSSAEVASTRRLSEPVTPAKIETSDAANTPVDGAVETPPKAQNESRTD